MEFNGMKQEAKDAAAKPSNEQNQAFTVAGNPTAAPETVIPIGGSVLEHQPEWPDTDETSTEATDIAAAHSQEGRIAQAVSDYERIRARRDALIASGELIPNVNRAPQPAPNQDV